MTVAERVWMRPWPLFCHNRSIRFMLHHETDIVEKLLLVTFDSQYVLAVSCYVLLRKRALTMHRIRGDRHLRNDNLSSISGTA